MVTVLALLLGLSSQSQATENFKLTVAAGIEKCVTTTTGNNTTVDCDIMGTVSPSSVNVALDQCGTDSTGAQFCVGQYMTNKSGDGLNFNGNVMVQHSSTGYMIFFAMAHEQETGNAATLISLSKNTLTDGTYHLGKMVQSSHDPKISYFPILVLLPEGGNVTTGMRSAINSAAALR